MPTPATAAATVQSTEPCHTVTEVLESKFWLRELPLAAKLPFLVLFLGSAGSPVAR